MTCSIEGLDRPSPSTPHRDIDEDVADLEARHVSPDTFHREQTSRFVPSQTQCRADTVQNYQRYQDWLVERVGNLPPREIAQRVRALYQQAYTYNPTTHEMPLTNPQAKARLDLWIGIIDARSFQDETFLQGLMRETDIPLITTLNSPNLAPRERGMFHRLETHQTTFAALSAEEARSDHAWLQSYEGHISFNEDPYQKSIKDMHDAYILFLGEEVYNRSIRENIPRAEMEIGLQSDELRSEYLRLQPLTDDQLFHRFVDVQILANSAEASPAIMRRMTRETHVLYIMLTLRGRSVRDMVREENIRINIQGGLSRQDAETLEAQGNPKFTTSRLDDYRSRHTFIRQFSDLYRDTRRMPLTRALAHRLNDWANFMLNRHETGIPILWRDLEEARHQVDITTPLQTHGPISWTELVSRPPQLTYILAPGELGRGNDARRDPLVAARTTRIGGRPLLDVASSVVSQIVITSDESALEHNHGMALYLFGIVAISGETFHQAPGYTPLPAYFMEVYSHEIGHHLYAQQVFDDAPERLLWQTANERFAYATGLEGFDNYRATLPAQARSTLAPFHTFMEDIIRIANRHLRLPESDMSRQGMDPRLSGHPSSEYAFNPGTVIEMDGSERPPLANILSTMSRRERDEEFSRYSLDFGMSHIREVSVRAQLRQTIEALNQLPSDQVSDTFQAPHPLVQLINFIRDANHTPHADHVTFSQESWLQFKDQLVGSYVGQQRTFGLRQDMWTREGNRFFTAEFATIPQPRRAILVRELNHYFHLAPGVQVTLPAAHPLVSLYNRYRLRRGITALPQITFTGRDEFMILMTSIMLMKRSLDAN